MRSGNSGHQPQNTDHKTGFIHATGLSRKSGLINKTGSVYKTGLMKTEYGQMEYVLGMYALIFVMVLVFASLQIMQYKADSDIAEDALAASCLAALDVDPYRYGLDHRLVINDPVAARRIFEKALKENMNLDAGFKPVSGDDKYISGRVTIDDFRVYLTDGNRVTEIRVTENGTVSSGGTYGTVRTPQGSVVRSAGVYARVSFDTKGFAGVKIRACKEAYAEMLADPAGSGLDRN